MVPVTPNRHISERICIMTYHILYNPLAGAGHSEHPWKHALTNNGHTVTDTDMTTLGDSAAYAAFFSRLSPEDAIILCGGDGTLNRFVNATDGLCISQEILYFPAGTGNDFLKDIGKRGIDAPISIKAYLQQLPTVTVKGKHYRFLNNVGFGIDGYCCEVGDAQKAANEGKEDPKPVNYTAIAIKGLLFHHKTSNAVVTVDGVERRYKKVWLAPTMKGRYYGGGMMPTPNQDRNADDGRLSIMVWHGSGKLRTLMAFPKIFEGGLSQYPKMVSVTEGYDIRVVFDRPTALQIDGETLLGVTEYHAVASVPAQTETPEEALAGA